MPQKVVLDTGVVVLVDTVPTSETVSVGAWVTTGSRDEQKGYYGYSHFTEHMLFKGTKRRSHYDIARAIDGVGGEINGATGREFTYYYVNVAKENFDIACDVLIDMYCASQFDEYEFQKEKAVILDEIELSIDDPEEYVNDLFSYTLWAKSSFGLPVVGTKEDVQSATLSALKDFYRDHYTKDRMVISVCGNVVTAQVVAKLAYLLHQYCTNNTRHITKSVKRQRPVSHAAIEYEERDIGQVYLICGTDCYPYNDSRRHAFSLLNMILGSSFSSRLFQQIREREGLCYSISSSFLSYSDVGEFSISFSSSSTNVVKVLQKIDDELKKIKNEGVSQEELERVKRKFRGNYTLAKESNEWKMTKMAMQQLMGGKLVSYEEVLDFVERVTRDDIVMVGRDILQFDKFCLTSLGSKSHLHEVSHYQFSF